MKKLLSLPVILITLSTITAQPIARDQPTGGACEDCELMYKAMPKDLSWQTQIAPPDEKGEPLIITGTIFKKDGKTPAPDVILYVYHTDAKGVYSASSSKISVKMHGHLRGWMKTGADGKYQFTTIRPASYPNRKAPQHIHPLIKEPSLPVYYIDEYLFDDDPLLTETERNRQEKRGGNGIIRLTKNNKGVWIGQRDIILGMNIPNY